jgi:hypothetical protein
LQNQPRTISINSSFYETPWCCFCNYNIQNPFIIFKPIFKCIAKKPKYYNSEFQKDNI